MEKFAETAQNLVAQTVITNPLAANDIFELIETVIRGIIILAIPIVVAAVIYAGYLFVSAQGNVEQLKKAKLAITYALIGAGILLGAEAIAQLIGGTLSALR